MIEIAVLLLLLIGWACHRGMLHLFNILVNKLAELFVGGMLMFGFVRLLL